MNARACMATMILAAILPVAPALASGTADDGDDTPSALVAAADFNSDGASDIAEISGPSGANSPQYVLTVRLGRGDGTYIAGRSRTLVGEHPRALVVGDFNGDGNPDVIVGDADGTLLQFLGDGRGNFRANGSVAKLDSVVSIAVGHFTRNGKLDLAVSDARSNSAVILVGAADGSFRRAWSFQLPMLGSEFHLAAADFNNDGVSDLVITKEDDEDYEVMLGNGNGTFTYAPELSHLKDPSSYCPT